MRFSDEARTATPHYLDFRPRDKYGKHDCSVGRFGLSASIIEPMLTEYIRRFADFTEGARQ